jgi:hypothetical protein
MNAREIERALAAADPLGGGRREELDRLDFKAMEAELLADVDTAPGPVPGVEPSRARRRPPRLALALGAAAVAAAIAVFIVLAGGGSERSSRAYGAELMRFAESTPLLLLEGSGWRVQEVTENRTRGGTEGQMEFVTGKPVPWGSITIVGNEEEGERAEGLQPAAERQRLVHLEWRDLGQMSLAEATGYQRERIHPHGRRFVRLPVTDTTAFVDTRNEIFVNQGGPGDREMAAIWSEGGNLLTMRAAVPNLAGMRERLEWVTKVDSQTWLEAMPAKVVKSADIEGTEREMLRGIPLPKSFGFSRIPNEGLTTSHGQVLDKVVNTVSCLWFRQWGEARRTGDRAAELEAVHAMQSYKSWPIVRQAEREGGFFESLFKLTKSMPSGIWQFGPHRWKLLPKAEGLGCARLGIPVLPRKMKRQRERGVPPPPD